MQGTNKGLLSSCEGQLEIGQHGFIFVFLVLPLAVTWDFGSGKRERIVDEGVPRAVTLKWLLPGSVKSGTPGRVS